MTGRNVGVSCTFEWCALWELRTTIEGTGAKVCERVLHALHRALKII
jgi:hypothetical protein